MPKIKFLLTVPLCVLLTLLSAGNPQGGKPEARLLVERAMSAPGQGAVSEVLARIAKEPGSYGFAEDEWDDLGYILLAGGRIDDAAAVFELGVRLFPENGNSYSSLAEAALLAGDEARARAMFQLALDKGAWGAARIRQRLAALNEWLKIAQRSLPGLGYGRSAPRLQGAYFGQTPPGDKPVLFAPGIVSMIGWSFACAWSPDGREFFFSRGNKKKVILASRLEAGGWTPPQPASFAQGRFASEPHLTLDNRRVYFGMGEAVMTSERTSEGWSQPVAAGPGMQYCSDRSGTLYAVDTSDIGRGRMFIARAVTADGIVQRLERLGGGVARAAETMQRAAHPCVAPDGSYLLFDNGRGLLHVSFRLPSGEWSEAVDLTKHGIDPGAGSAAVSPDGRFLFLSIHNDLHWMSAAFLDDLRRGAIQDKGSAGTSPAT